MVILRIAGVYDENCHSIPIAHQIHRIREKKVESYLFPGNAELGQSFVHLDDVADCLFRTVHRRNQLGHYELLLVGEPDVMSYEELQERIGWLLHGTAWSTIRIPKVLAKVGAWMEEKVVGDEGAFIKPWMVDLADAHYPVDPTRAEEKLGWVPRHSFRTTLDVMLDRLKEDPQRWYAINKLPRPTGQ